MIKAKGRFFRTGSFVVALFFVLLFTANGAIAKTGGADSETAAKTKAAEGYGKLPLSFIQNNGQTDKSVKFYERGTGHVTFFTAEGVYLQLVRSQESGVRSEKTEGRRQTKAENERQKADKKTLVSDTVRLIPLNSNPNPQIIAEAPQSGRVNYLIGNDPKMWKANIPTYGAVVYKDLYKGIDMKFYGNNRQFEYDIIVSAGTDPSQVKLSYEGIQGLKVTEAGDLEISLKESSIIQKRPHVYQVIAGRKVEVKGRFNLNSPSPLRGRGAGKYSYGFQIASYNKAYPLIIDPVLDYSTYLGGSGSGYDTGYSIAVDGSGNAYVTGRTVSTDFPTKNPIQGALAGYEDAFVTKINAAGNALVYSTYLGGSVSDYGTGIAVDGSGNAYVTGGTASTDFPTKNPIQGALAGRAFVTKINAAGNALVYSTYLGGSGGDQGNGITVDGSGNAYVTGQTGSTDFPTKNPIQGALGAGTLCNSGFVTKINAAGSALIYSTYLGGSGDFVDSFGSGIAVDDSGNAYVTGLTNSTNFPTKNPIQGTIGGGYYDAFVTKINAAGNALVYSTYLGGDSVDWGYGIAVDGSGNAYVTGQTGSTDFPTKNPIQGAPGKISAENAFVTKINAEGNALVYSTYLGGSGDILGGGNDIAVDGSGNAYVTGATSSTDFPTKKPIQGALAGRYNAYVTKINAAGTALVYSTYLGGSGGGSGDGDYGYGIAVDGSGNAYVTGFTLSTDFPTKNPIQGALAGYPNAFVTKIGDQASVPPTLGTLTPSVLVSGPEIGKIFTAIYRDADGYENIKKAFFRVHTTANGIYLRYDRPTNKLFLYNDAGTATVGSCTPGVTGTLKNTQGRLNCAATAVSVSDNDLTIKWKITPKTAFASPTKKDLYMKVIDMTGLKAGWRDKGDWTIKP